MSTVTFYETFPIETILRNPQIRKAQRDREKQKKYLRRTRTTSSRSGDRRVRCRETTTSAAWRRRRQAVAAEKPHQENTNIVGGWLDEDIAEEKTIGGAGSEPSPTPVPVEHIVKEKEEKRIKQLVEDTAQREESRIEQLVAEQGQVEQEQERHQRWYGSLSEKQQGEYQRCGKIDENKCQARIWITKPQTRGRGYPNIQCSHGCHRGETYCKVHHGKKEKHGSWWLGDITDPPLHEVFGPPGRPSGPRMHKFADP